jgi:thioredoxin-like negative regulator of GroEL
VGAFAKEPHPNSTLYALALLADARTDFQAHQFSEAARKFDEVARLSPRNAPSLYQTALAHLGAGDLEKARSEFGQVREEEMITEAQYGSDVARHLQEVGGATAVGPGGKSLQEMDNSGLESEIKSAAASLREARSQQESGKASEVTMRDAERRFFSLVAEWMLRGNPIREAALSGGYADLIRR